MERFNTQPFMEEDNGAWDTIHELHPRGAKIPVFIRAAKSAETEKRWQVARLNSVSFFNSYAEARGFCKERGWA